MLYRKIISVCSEIHTEHINTLCGQNVIFVYVKRAGIHSNHWYELYILSPYRAVNTLPLCYKNHSVNFV